MDDSSLTEEEINDLLQDVFDFDEDKITESDKQRILREHFEETMKKIM